MICVLVFVVALPVIRFCMPDYGMILGIDIALAIVCGGAAWAAKNGVLEDILPKKTNVGAEARNIGRRNDLPPNGDKDGTRVPRVPKDPVLTGKAERDPNEERRYEL